MPPFNENINLNSSNIVSRNRPVAFVVRAGSFLGSFLVEALLNRGIQVIGWEDINEENRKNLEQSSKDKNFHLINKPLSSQLLYNLPRLDYAFYIPEKNIDHPHQVSLRELDTFLNFIKKHQEKASIVKPNQEDVVFSSKPKTVFISSIKLYQRQVEGVFRRLKDQEINFAKFVKTHKLNGRVVRLAHLYGPRMDIAENEPFTNLLKASLLNELENENSSNEFTTRALFIEDGVELILKSVFVGSTANKIFDGILTPPVKVSEIRQVLIDPLWYEERGFTPSELPPWPTPNIKKTIKELSWHPRQNLVKSLRETIVYFKENFDLEKLKNSKPENKKWVESTNEKKIGELSKEKKELLEQTFLNTKQEIAKSKQEKFKINLKVNPNLKGRALLFVGIGIIMLGLFLPLATLVWGGLSVRNHLNESRVALEKGDFQKALSETNSTKYSLEQIRDLTSLVAIVPRIGILKKEIGEVNKLLDISHEGINGVSHAISGMDYLYQTTKIISGEQRGDLKPLYDKSRIELAAANDKLSHVILELGGVNPDGIHPLLKPRIKDFQAKIVSYKKLIEKAETASILLPEIA